jgi:hypothetical protein
MVACQPFADRAPALKTQEIEDGNPESKKPGKRSGLWRLLK